MAIKDFLFRTDEDELERRRQLIRDVWQYRHVDHIPIQFTIVPAKMPTYTTREKFRDGDKQLEAGLAVAKASWGMIPDGDYLPAVRPDVGCSCLASAFGAKLDWGDDLNQTNWVAEHIVKSVDDIDRLPEPDPLRDGDLPEGIRRARRFIELTDGQICVSGLDMAGGINVALDLVGDGLYLMMYDQPQAVHHLLAKVQRLFLRTIQAQIDVVGGEQHFTTLDFPDTWFPDGLKGHASDDVCAMIRPEHFEEFSLPYLNMVYQRYGPGGLHNCGPNPCGHLYNKTTPPVRSVNLAYRYSQQDLPMLKKAFARQTVLYLDMPGPDPAQTYRQVMEIMAPDVVVIPMVSADEKTASEAWKRMLAVAREYAARMKWKG